MSKILLVEDDDLVLEAIADTLETNNFVVEKVRDGQEAADRLKLYSYDLAILDIGLPKINGFDVCRNHRAAGGITPILMLTGKGEIEDRVSGLDAGADDYLPKPFHMRELVARVRSLLRRPPGCSEMYFVCAELLSILPWEKHPEMASRSTCWQRNWL